MSERPAAALVWIAAYGAAFAQKAGTYATPQEALANASDVAGYAAAIATVAGEQFEELKAASDRERDRRKKPEKAHIATGGVNQAPPLTRAEFYRDTDG